MLPLFLVILYNKVLTEVKSKIQHPIVAAVAFVLDRCGNCAIKIKLWYFVDNQWKGGL